MIPLADLVAAELERRGIPVPDGYGKLTVIGPVGVLRMRAGTEPHVEHAVVNGVPATIIAIGERTCTIEYEHGGRYVMSQTTVLVDPSTIRWRPYATPAAVKAAQRGRAKRMAATA